MSNDNVVPITIDDIQEYWSRKPCNIGHSNKEIGTKEYFDEVETRKYFVEPHIPGFASFDKWTGKKVLEIGCGIGTDATNFMRAGADYYGVDLSKESLKIAKQRFSVFGFDPERLQEANAEKLSEYFEKESFDLVYSFGVIHHTPEPKKIIESIKKILKKDGILKIMLYAKNSWKSYMIDIGLDQPEAQYGCPIANVYTNDEVSDLLDGFSDISITQDHIFPYIVTEYKKYNYVPEKWFSSMPKEMFQQLEKKLGWHLLIEASF